VKRLFLQLLAIVLALLVVFGAASPLGVEGFFDPARWASAGTPAVALLSIAVLAVDVLLPVPSSLVMTANGALFGAWGGAVVSLIGSVAASVVAYAIGRSRLASQLLRPEEDSRSGALLERWGGLAVALSRPLPLLAEAVGVIAGARRMPFLPFLAASMAGCAPMSSLYALIGAGTRMYTLPLALLAYAVVAGATYALARRTQRLTLDA
jgi:uncharacterized membrane protein YdjX (TVP38/TMEM64 family)